MHFDDGLEQADVHRGKNEVPMSENHRGAGAAEDSRRRQKARHGQRLIHRRPAGGRRQRLQHERDRAGADRGCANGRPHRRKRSADRCPVEDDGGFADGERHEVRIGVGGCGVHRPRRHRHGDERGREAGVEPEELHAGGTADKGERKGDAYREI
ncbi:MAG TPA: hypothetical protein VJP86_08110 [Vicinamibacterales bacterium]|nr:hypothetical protein [Vicinamibacterales bacterium]